MWKNLVKTVFGTRHDREVKRLTPLVDQINREWERLKAVSEEELKGQTVKFRSIITERTAELDAELEELRSQKRQSESSVEREALSARIAELEKSLYQAV